jgi:hypothetical protein
MVQAIRKRVQVQPGGVVEVHDPELPEGATAEVIVLLDTGQPATEPLPPLAGMIGAAKGLFNSPEEVEAYIRSLRDEWD